MESAENQSKRVKNKDKKITNGIYYIKNKESKKISMPKLGK